MNKEKIGSSLLMSFGVVALLALFFIEPILQDVQYHHFSDVTTVFGIPNFWNVISNFPFVIVGVMGLRKFIFSGKEKLYYGLLFLGVLLTGIGSSYYHMCPNSQSLIWDRMPMTIVFMTLFSIIISEFVSERLGRLFLIPSILIGLSSIVYWVFGSDHDLRLYVLVQFYPLIAIAIILIFFKSKYNKSNRYLILLLTYLFAKIFESFDHEIHEFLGVISGHSLKHIIAAIGLYVLLDSYKKRSLIVKQSRKL